MPEDHFGEEIAANYDRSLQGVFTPEVLGPTVDLLAGLAGDGPALEFAIGTGRVALPLAARGVPVSGIEYSTAMADRLRAKPGAAAIDVTIGDMATTRVPGRFRLVYLVFNTIGNLTSQDEQVACFANAAAHLEPGGLFLIEVAVPDLRRLPPGQDAVVFAHTPGYVGYDHYVDPVAQLAVSHHFTTRGAGGGGGEDAGGGEGGAGDTVGETTTPFRYVWPSELDLMARLAGLELRHRWADWSRAPFTADSPAHVSVWEKPPAGPDRHRADDGA